jgi:hypothetical protein
MCSKVLALTVSVRPTVPACCLCQADNSEELTKRERMQRRGQVIHMEVLRHAAGGAAGATDCIIHGGDNCNAHVEGLQGALVGCMLAALLHTCGSRVPNACIRDGQGSHTPYPRPVQEVRTLQKRVCMYVCDYIAVSLLRTLTSPALWDANCACVDVHSSVASMVSILVLCPLCKVHLGSCIARTA